MMRKRKGEEEVMEKGEEEKRRRKKGWRRKERTRLSFLTQSRDEDGDAAATLVGNIFQWQL